jgi:hypothetical protein
VHERILTLPFVHDHSLHVPPSGHSVFDLQTMRRVHPAMQRYRRKAPTAWRYLTSPSGITTKGKTTRRFAVDPDVMPLLRAMHAEAKGKGDVCPLPNRMADRLRGWLETAAIKRHPAWEDERASVAPRY